MFKLFSAALLIIACAQFSYSGDFASCGGFPVAAEFSEEMITLSWADVPGAAAYNVYFDKGNGPVKANFVPVRTRNRFSLLWMESDGKKERIVKGNRINLCVVPLFAKVKNADTVYSEGKRSCSVTNSYFSGFSNILDSIACCRVIQPRQTTQKILIPSAAVQLTRSVFCGRYGRLARDIDVLYKTKIDPRDEGACVPFSTMVAKYFTANGIPCYRAQGAFIEAFHSFNIVVVDSVEYVLDFTADQFVPGNAPVFMPRDWCFVDSCGKPTSRQKGIFTKMYRIETVFASDQINFTDTPKAKEYQRLLDSLENRQH